MRDLWLMFTCDCRTSVTSFLLGQESGPALGAPYPVSHHVAKLQALFLPSMARGHHQLVAGTPLLPWFYSWFCTLTSDIWKQLLQLCVGADCLNMASQSQCKFIAEKAWTSKAFFNPFQFHFLCPLFSISSSFELNVAPALCLN